MLEMTFHDCPLSLGPQNFFKLGCGVRPSFGFFRAPKTTVDYALDTMGGAAGNLVFEEGGTTLTFRKIYLVKSVSVGAIDDQICDIIFADERILWQYYYGAQDYNSYGLSRTKARKLNGETDFELNNLKTRDPPPDTEWTFKEIFIDIFENVLGWTDTEEYAQSELPDDFTNLEPRNIIGKNVPVPEILYQLLEQSQCYLVADPLHAVKPYYRVYKIGAQEIAADLSTIDANTSKLIKKKVIQTNPLTRMSDAAEMVVGSPEESGGLFKGFGDATNPIGGTGLHMVPSLYAALYAGGDLQNETFLEDVGDEVCDIYAASFANTWRDSVYAGVIFFALNRAIHEITWNFEKGVTTHIKSFRPREKPFPPRDTFLSYGSRYWLGGGGVGIRRAEIAEVPTNQAYIKASLLNASTGEVATAGDEFELNIYANICNGVRLDRASPKLNIGDILTVHRVIYDDAGTPAERWYFVQTFDSTEEYIGESS